MRTVYEERIAEATAIEGRLSTGSDKIVPPSNFGPVCKVLWPDKTAACIAAIARRDERTAKRWLSGEFEPPNILVLAVMHKIFAR